MITNLYMKVNNEGKYMNHKLKGNINQWPPKKGWTEGGPGWVTKKNADVAYIYASLLGQ